MLVSISAVQVLLGNFGLHVDVSPGQVAFGAGMQCSSYDKLAIHPRQPLPGFVALSALSQAKIFFWLSADFPRQCIWGVQVSQAI